MRWLHYVLSLLINAIVVLLSSVVTDWARVYWSHFVQGSIPFPRLTSYYFRFDWLAYFLPLTLIVVGTSLLCFGRKSRDHLLVQLSVTTYIVTAVFAMLALLALTLPYHGRLPTR